MTTDSRVYYCCSCCEINRRSAACLPACLPVYWSVRTHVRTFERACTCALLPKYTHEKFSYVRLVKGLIPDFMYERSPPHRTLPGGRQVYYGLQIALLWHQPAATAWRRHREATASHFAVPTESQASGPEVQRHSRWRHCKQRSTSQSLKISKIRKSRKSISEKRNADMHVGDPGGCKNVVRTGTINVAGSPTTQTRNSSRSVLPFVLCIRSAPQQLIMTLYCYFS